MLLTTTRREASTVSGRSPIASLVLASDGGI
jgi:hypothetical protein